MKYPHFHDALMALGSTNRERAAALGISLRAFMAYKRGDWLPKADLLLRFPSLHAALQRDRCDRSDTMLAA